MARYPKFQSMHPRGVQQNKRKGFGTYPDISIHAPSRGATVKANRINASDLQNIKQFLQLTHPQLSHTTGLLALLCILSLYPRCEPPLETM